MENLELYNALRTPPDEALSPIAAGRMKGKTDINPMWRIKALTEQLGPCGIGWKYIITKQWLESSPSGEIAAFCNIDLYYKLNGEWSEAVPGTGGSSFVAKEKSGPYVSDECYKMALTDAISVAAKALGVAGDIYWQNDPTKYNAPKASGSDKGKAPLPKTCVICGKPVDDDVYKYSVQHYGKVYCGLDCAKQAGEKA